MKERSHEDGLIHTPVSCATYQYLPSPLALDMISPSCLLVALPQPQHTCIIIHQSICLTTQKLSPQSTHNTPHTQNNQIYLCGDDKILSRVSGFGHSWWELTLCLCLWGWIDTHSCVLYNHINNNHPIWPWIWYHQGSQHTHNNQLTYSHPLALDMISSMH